MEAWTGIQRFDRFDKDRLPWNGVHSFKAGGIGQEHGWVLFCVFRGTMARIDWLGDMGTGFGKAVPGIALNKGVFGA